MATHIGQQQDVINISPVFSTWWLNSTASLIESISAAKATSIISEKPIFINASLSISKETFSPNCPAIAGATAAITVSLFFIKSIIGRSSILSKKWPLSHTWTHIPQFWHRFGSIYLLLSIGSVSIALKG